MEMNSSLSVRRYFLASQTWNSFPSTQITIYLEETQHSLQYWYLFYSPLLNPHLPSLSETLHSLREMKKTDITAGHLHTCGDERSSFVIKRTQRFFILLLFNSLSLMVACIIAMTDGVWAENWSGELVRSHYSAPLLSVPSVSLSVTLFLYLLSYLWRCLVVYPHYYSFFCLFCTLPFLFLNFTLSIQFPGLCSGQISSHYRQYQSKCMFSVCFSCAEAIQWHILRTRWRCTARDKYSIQL